MYQTIIHYWDLIPLFGRETIQAFLIFSIFFLIAHILSKLLTRISIKKHISRNISKFLIKLLRSLILLIGLITALGTAGVNMTALVASLGLASFGASYALKDMLQNIISGLIIIINGRLKISDHISINNYDGVIEQIGLRYTTLRVDADKKIYQIPNGIFMTGTLTIFDQ